MGGAEGGNHAEEGDAEAVLFEDEGKDGEQSGIAGGIEEGVVVVGSQFIDDAADFLASSGGGFTQGTAPKQGSDGIPVGYEWPHATRMEEEAHQVSLTTAEALPDFGVKDGDQVLEGRIGEAEIPGMVHRDGGKGLVVGEGPAEGRHDLLHLGVVEVASPEQGGETRGHQPFISFAKREV